MLVNKDVALEVKVVGKPRLKFTSKSEYVYQVLRERIIQGELQTNKRYKAVDIAAELGVSRTPVSNAVKILASQGYVTLLPSVGFEIKQLTLKEVEGILLIRGALEELAIELAMDNVSPRDIADLRKILPTCERAIERQDSRKYSELNKEFHFNLYQFADLPNLIETFETLWIHEGWYSKELKNNPENILTLVKDHYEIVDLIEKKEKNRIKALVRRHIYNCLHVVSESLSNIK
jgi:DNA-binding GntR family transcriptional regulator